MPGDALIDFVVANGLWGDSDLCLVDVGASGGIHARWSDYGDRLRAVGFDPLVLEVERLNGLETRPKVRYEALSVGAGSRDHAPPRVSSEDRQVQFFLQTLERSSALAAHRILNMDYIRSIYNTGSRVEYSSRTTTLDEYFAAPQVLRPDFLKVDTDGDDYDVLLGGAKLIESGAFLGISIEVRFQGDAPDRANSFSNIDRFLRPRGFTLFDLETHRYSRSALPAPFAIGVPAQTVSGQVRWGEALYFRDLASPGYEKAFGLSLTGERILKLCCLFRSHGLSDCAAELLVTSEVLRALHERSALIDLLTPTLFGDTRYDEYIARFNANPAAWLPQNLPRQPEPVPPAAAAASGPQRLIVEGERR